MSEYQYYEFQAIDRPLSKAAQEEMRGLSSRAQVTPTSFTNTYNYGDFRGNADSLMAEWFDLHLHMANWGTRRLMIRVPERLIDRRIVEACLVEPEIASVRNAGEHLILDVALQEMDTGWDEGPGWLAELAPLRADLLAGDQRLLYLVWLMAVEFGGVRDDTPEPLPGIGPLTEPLKAFASFFCLDSDLIRAAAERDATPGSSDIRPGAARDAIAGLPDRDKTAFLARLFEGDPHAGAELRLAVRARLNAGRVTPKVAPRTAGELRARAEASGIVRQQETARKQVEEQTRLEREAGRKRRERLIAIARRGDGVWRDVEAEIERANASSYDRAVVLLLDLRDVAGERDTLADFRRRVTGIRERHARKARFLERIGDLG